MVSPTRTRIYNGIHRPALRWHGGKFAMRATLLSLLPPHVCFVEPYGGAGSIILSKEPSGIDVYNDLDMEVVNFFQVLRERSEELLQKIYLTPYSRAEQLRSHLPTDDLLESARRFYVRSIQSFGGPTRGCSSGWRYVRDLQSRASPIRKWNKMDHLWAVVHRLKQIHIECKPALETIHRFDGTATLFYCDPPYLPATRSVMKAYRHEMTESDHIALAETLNSVEGLAMLSGYDSDLYQRLYKGWHKVTKSISINSGKKAIECIWLSPKAALNNAQAQILLPLDNHAD